MTGPEYQAAEMRAPSGSGAPTKDDRLAGTTGEDHNTVKLTPGEMATILVGAQAIRFEFAGATGLTNQVSSTSKLLPANGRFDWLVVEDVDDVIYIESSDASTAYEAWVWTSSGPR